MSLDAWMIVWKVCLVGSLSIFAVLAVLVTFGGAADVRRLFARLRDHRDEES